MSLTAILVAQGNPFDGARRAARRAQALAAAKRLALVAMEYSSDHGDRLPDASRFRAQIAPYMKDFRGLAPEQIADPLAVPYEPRGTTFFLDPRLSGRLDSSIRRASEVAMILIGQNGRATFPYDGDTIVAYADGHGARVTRAQLERARKVPLK